MKCSCPPFPKPKFSFRAPNLPVVSSHEVCLILKLLIFWTDSRAPQIQPMKSSPAGLKTNVKYQHAPFFPSFSPAACLWDSDICHQDEPLLDPLTEDSTKPCRTKVIRSRNCISHLHRLYQLHWKLLKSLFHHSEIIRCPRQHSLIRIFQSAANDQLYPALLTHHNKITISSDRYTVVNNSRPRHL